MIERLKNLLPAGWFRDDTPILDGVLTGISWGLTAAQDLADYARLQARIATAADGFLDLVSLDFFGDTLPRRANESDASFRGRIQAGLFPERGTRQGMIRALTLLTGRTPIIFEQGKTLDTGAYNTTRLSYNGRGGYGSLMLAYQAFIIAYRPLQSGAANRPAYNNAVAYDEANFYYTDLQNLRGSVTDQDIYDTVDRVKVAGTKIWVRIDN